MGKYRKLPFGYCMEFGRIVVHPHEKPWVEYIFHEYALGASFKELTESMETEGIPYGEDKLWNKNIIARMLSDDRYTGEKGFPAIIKAEAFERATQRRDSKQKSVSKTEAQKALGRKCECKVTPFIEQEVLFLLNNLAEYPEQIAMPHRSERENRQQDLLKTELDALLMESPVNEECTRAKMMELASAMYQSVGPEEYETHRMRQVFQRESSQSELNVHLIKNNITAIQMDSRRKVRLILKNNQVIEKG